MISVGHKGKYGHEFIEFEIQPNGRLRYGNNSNYKADCLIRKEVYVNDIVIDEIKKIIKESTIMQQDDAKWPKPDHNGCQELEIAYQNEHISFCTSKIGSSFDVQKSQDPEGMKIFYYLIQDLKCLVFSLITIHFRIKPVQG